MGLADEFLDDARELAAQSYASQRPSQMRRAISTAYYAVFHLFVEHWEFEDQRVRLGRMFNHGAMRNAAYKLKTKSPTPLEIELIDLIEAFGQLQKNRHRADYDFGWPLAETDVRNSVTLAEEILTKWREIKGETIARNHLLSMFGSRVD